MRILKQLAIIGLFAAAVGSSFFSMTAQASVSVTWGQVTLNENGDAGWSASYAASEAVDRYELQLARMRDGVWNTDYKTYRTSENSYDIHFGSSGKYYYKVRAKFVGGDYSDWSPNSNTVTVTSDDLDDRDTDPWYYFYGSGIANADGTYTYQVPAGPGANAPLITVTTGGSSVINAASSTGSATIYNGFGGMGYSNYGTLSRYQGGPAAGGTVIGQAPAGNAASGWLQTGSGWTYRYTNNTVPKNTWDRINDKWYYFNASGIMQTGWVWYQNQWYYCLPTGEMATGWNNINDQWYYLNPSGIMQIGYISIDGKVYYCDAGGARVQGGYNPDGHQFDINGVMIE